MAKAKIAQNLLQAHGGFSKRTRWNYPSQKIDLNMQIRADSVIIGKKTKRSQKSTEKQKEQREKWKLFDCIWKELTHTQRKAFEDFYRKWEQKKRKGWTPYHWFMSRALQNYMKNELREAFRVKLDEIQIRETDSWVIITCNITQDKFSEDDFIESFYERIARRT